MIRICGGLEGPKSEKFEKPWVFHVFLRQGGPEGSRKKINRASRAAKIKFLMNVLCRHSELWFLPRRWQAHFQKKHEKIWSEHEKWSRKTLDGKCNGYMWGLGGAQRGTC